jgi:mono/diheme cytochrome c family protein
MEEKAKQEYLERYQEAKKKGVPFFPDILFKDAVISLLVFVALIALTYFLGAPLEERADPADTNYTPRPEWYFLFLFQLLKYFPGQLEVIGVVVLPTLAIILLFLLPLLDRSKYRHFSKRPIVVGTTALTVVGVAVLSYLSIRETPPPAEAAGGDQTAMLYTSNCAGCHGPSIDVPAGTNLHAVIAQGQHEGMPAWSADLTTDQIDSLAGFVLSPGGSQLFTQHCGACHEAPELVASDPIELKTALEEGPNYPSHVDVEIPEWTAVMDRSQRTALLNFLVAPDGQRLFAIDCAPCHGSAVGFSGDQQQLRAIINQGGLHLEMPPWRERLDDRQLDTLAAYVVDPGGASEGEALFGEFCSDCHGERVPAMASVPEAREVIASGGSHETMPVWGEVLTPEQLDALVSYTLDASQGSSLELGQRLYNQNCSVCHGDFGEGGPNPARPDDIIAPISTSEYLQTRDDSTLRAIISQGQPNFGMSPFGSSYGGPLDDSEIDALIAFIRSWESDPPVELPPEVASTPISQSGPEIYAEVCAQCHGVEGGGGIGPSLADPALQARFTDETLFDSINMGHEATAMIAWGEILSSEQIQQLVGYIRELGAGQPTGEPGTEEPEETQEPDEPSEAPSFSGDVLPVFEAKCTFCHGSLGGWDASSYEAVMSTGDNAPVVIPGDSLGSLLGQKLLGTHTEGDIMPPAGMLPEDEIQIILDWIDAGAPNN